jgi:hypothetical protein
VGSLKIDSVDQALDENSEASAKLSNGSHSIAWTTPGGNTLEFELVVTDDHVEAKNLTFQGRLVGLLATVQRGAVSYQTMNSSGGVTHTTDGQPVTGASSGTFPIESSKLVSFAVKPGGYPLGEVLANPDGHPLVFVYLAPQSQESKSAVAAPKVVEPPPPENRAGPVTLPKPSPDELRQQKQKEINEQKAKYLEDLKKGGGGKQ